MSILAKIDTTKEYDLHGVKIKIGSIDIDDDTAKLMDGAEDTPIIELLKVMKNIVRKTIKEYIPDATEQEIQQQMKMANLTRWIDIIYDVNGLKDKEKKSDASKIKDAIEKRKQAQQNKK